MSILSRASEPDEADSHLTDNMRQLIWKKKFEEAAEKLLREKTEEEKNRRKSLDVAD